MFELFKTVFFLSCIGAVLILFLLALKPMTVNRFPVRWQYAMWLVVALCMLVPAWKFIPKQNVEMLAPDDSNQAQELLVTQTPDSPERVIIEDMPIEDIDTSSVEIYDLIAYIWFGGVCIYLCLAVGSYVVFLIKKRKGSFGLAEDENFEEVKKELHIKRKIKVRVSNDADSPMLVGVLFPVIYTPNSVVDKEAEKMIYCHELTHYKNKDLLCKWFVLFVNAVHWFNPLVYLLNSNVSQACEVVCDMAVIKNSDEEEKKLYMNTILDLVEKKGR